MDSSDGIRVKLRAVNSWLVTQVLTDWPAIPSDLPYMDSTLSQ